MRSAYDAAPVNTTSRRTLEEDFQHFLVYTGFGRFCTGPEIVRLRIAYQHGCSRGRGTVAGHGQDDGAPAPLRAGDEPGR
jgi:hypothetical protein